MTNICTEITLFSDFGHSLVCCLSSLNLARYDEWKETDVIKTAVYFLEGVLNEYIRKASGMIGHEKTVRFAEKSRAIGIGVLGWHTLLQKRMEPFGSFEAMRLNAEIHSKIARESAEASVELAAVFGEPEWCRGTGRRHSHLTAVAPTRSNSIVSGSVSYGVEPIPANAFVERTSTGATIKRNRILEELLERKGHNTDEIWSAIVKNNGSVAGLPEEILSAEEKAVFLTAYELNQYDIIRQAAQRQQFIEQAQSINLFFPPNVDPRYFHGVHKKAWEMGMKSLYYCRTTSVLIADSASRTSEEQGRRNLESRIYRTFDECSACES
jgi:ribonucleoside-diphosphate reductase alpha chain